MPLGDSAAHLTAFGTITAIRRDRGRLRRLDNGNGHEFPRIANRGETLLYGDRGGEAGPRRGRVCAGTYWWEYGAGAQSARGASRAAWHHALNQADDHQQDNRSNDGVNDLWYKAGTDVDAHSW